MINPFISFMLKMVDVTYAGAAKHYHMNIIIQVYLLMSRGAKVIDLKNEDTIF